MLLPPCYYYCHHAKATTQVRHATATMLPRKDVHQCCATALVDPFTPCALYTSVVLPRFSMMISVPATRVAAGSWYSRQLDMPALCKKKKKNSTIVVKAIKAGFTLVEPAAPLCAPPLGPRVAAGQGQAAVSGGQAAAGAGQGHADRAGVDGSEGQGAAEEGGCTYEEVGGGL